MIRKYPFAFLYAWCVFGLSVSPLRSVEVVATAAAKASATISGRVQNVVTGQFLNNARVTISGSDLVAHTDETGRYVLSRVPAGEHTIVAFYTGLETGTEVVAIAPDQDAASVNFSLTSASRYGDAVELDSFVVASSRQLDAATLATNEQRFAPNIKNVVAADAFGDATGGNVAEMIKFIPGIAVTTGGSGEAAEVSVRGMSTHLTNVSMDGAQVAQAHTISNTRGFEFKNINVAAISRIEVTKLPLPSTRADSLSGTVDLVSKSAFDRSNPELRYRAYLTMNSDWMTFRRQPFPYETKVNKVQPGFDLAYTKPVTENLGFVITAAHNRAYNPQNIEIMTWRGTGTGTGASPDNPYLQAYRFFDAPKVQLRQSFSTKVDWRIQPHGVLSFNFVASRFRDDNANFNWTFDAGTNGTPLPASGEPLTFASDRTEGATGRAAVNLGGGHHHYTQRMYNENIRYLFDDGTWRILAVASHSNSTTKSNAMDRFGDFFQLASTLNQPARLVLGGVSGGRPASVQAFDNAGQPIDLHDLNNYRLNNATSGTRRDIADTVRNVALGVRRTLESMPYPMSLEIGGSYRDQDRNNRRPSWNWAYQGMNGDRSPAPFASQVFSTTSPVNAGRNAPWASPKIAYRMWQENPNLFVQTPQQVVAEHTSVVSNSTWFKEAVSALYIEGSVRLFENRLKVVTGVRYEETRTNGLGPLVDPAAVWVRNPDGLFARTPAGERIRRQEAGEVGSIEQYRLTHVERAVSRSRSYDGFYPSIHFTYNISPNLLARVAYARTYGRPNFTEIVPTTTIDQDDINLDENPNAIPGSIDISNPGLLPWTANNFDLSLEYYTDQGGLFTAGAFRKDITDFFGAVATIATAADIEKYNLDPRYIGWTLRTTTNAGDARVTGIEFAMQHSLAFAGDWGRHFEMFLNGTKLKLDGEDEADWRGFVPEMLNWGVTYTRKPFMVRANWTYQGESQLSPVTTVGPGAFQYRKARTTMDVNLEYFLRESFSLFVNVRNLLNEPVVTRAYNAQTPAYARDRQIADYGAAISFGVKGTF